MLKTTILGLMIGCVTCCKPELGPPVTGPPSAPTPSPTPPPTPLPTVPSPGSSSPNSCECGKANTIGRRIVGGAETTAHKYPWQVGLADPGKNEPFCGGSLISNQHILTAAHCTTGHRTIHALLGDHSLHKSEEKRVRVCSIKDHPGYRRTTSNNAFSVTNDFSVLTLCESVEFTKKISPVCLPAIEGQGAEYEARFATISGWGNTRFGGPQSNVLQEAVVRTMTNKECCSSDKAYSCSALSDAMICASNPGVDACQKDSGGPMVVLGRNGRYVLIGVVSWGDGCAKENAPGVYARVTNQLNWIKEGVDSCSV